MTRLLVLAALCGIVLVACGGGGTNTEVFREVHPHVRQIYVQIRGPRGAVPLLARLLRGKPPRRLIVVRKAHGPKRCSFFTEIGGSSAVGRLKKYAGQKFAMTVYGDIKPATDFCTFLGTTGR
jgi:hypothetical protein